MSHGDHVDVPPEGFQVVASSKHLFDETKFVDAIYNPEKQIYGFQFHPEVFVQRRPTTTSARGRKMAPNPGLLAFETRPVPNRGTVEAE